MNRIEGRLSRTLRVCITSFSVEKFMLGLKRLDILNPLVKIKKHFKIYNPCLNSGVLYDCPPLQAEFEGTNGTQDPDKKYILQQFLSNLAFLDDLSSIPKRVDHSKPKKEKQAEIKELLDQINKQLPSFVYIPSDGNSPSLQQTSASDE